MNESSPRFAIRPGAEQAALAHMAERGFAAVIETAADGQVYLVFPSIADARVVDLAFALPVKLGAKAAIIGDDPPDLSRV